MSPVYFIGHPPGLYPPYPLQPTPKENRPRLRASLQIRQPRPPLTSLVGRRIHLRRRHSPPRGPVRRPRRRRSRRGHRAAPVPSPITRDSCVPASRNAPRTSRCSSTATNTGPPTSAPRSPNGPTCSAPSPKRRHRTIRADGLTTEPGNRLLAVYVSLRTRNEREDLREVRRLYWSQTRRGSLCALLQHFSDRCIPEPMASSGLLLKKRPPGTKKRPPGTPNYWLHNWRNALNLWHACPRD